MKLRLALGGCALALLAPAPAALAADPIMKLSDVRPGMMCKGLSVVRGTARPGLLLRGKLVVPVRVLRRR